MFLSRTCVVSIYILVVASALYINRGEDIPKDRLPSSASWGQCRPNKSAGGSLLAGDHWEFSRLRDPKHTTDQ